MEGFTLLVSVDFSRILLFTSRQNIISSYQLQPFFRQYCERLGCSCPNGRHVVRIDSLVLEKEMVFAKHRARVECDCNGKHLLANV